MRLASPAHRILLLTSLLPAAAGAQTIPQNPPKADEPIVTLEKFVSEERIDDPLSLLPQAPLASSFGFSKTLLETPRSVSYVSGEVIDAMALSAVEDLVRVVPGVYTTTRFGIQGSIDVRNVPADTYFRGMKRINLQGHGRSVLAAMDSIEVVKGPPSPIFGMGKIGGYTNLVPKAGRAKIGGYLSKNEGFLQAIVGSYDKREASFGLGGPLSAFGRKGGFYVYGLIEDSDSYVEFVPIKQKILQASISLDNAVGPFRLEAGFSYQVSNTAGAFLNRWTQDLVDQGRYVTGSALVNLDLNGNGKIGFLEMNQASPVRGNLSAANQPLSQRFNWPRDSAGNYLPLGSFPKIAGIPATMLAYLQVNPAADPTGLLRAQGAGGPLPTSGQVPVGFVLDPRTAGYTQIDYRRPGALERELEAEFIIAYADLVLDHNPDLTFRNQLFFDSQDQLKLSEQPGGGKQDVYVFENKMTATRRFSGLPDWLSVNALASANLRSTKSTGFRYGGDFGTNRTDAMNSRGGAMGPNETFVHPFENSDLTRDGAPWTSNYRTDYWEAGYGALLDVDLFRRLNLLGGARYDRSGAENVDYAAFNVATGNSANPGRLGTTDSRAKKIDAGASWSASVSYQLPYNIRPYFTAARSSLTLESNNNKLDNAVINNGHIGEAEIQEAGVKASLLGGKVFLATAVYEQTRTDVTVSDDASIIGAEVSSTETRGWETEVKWVPNRRFSVSAFGLVQETEYLINGGGNILVDARTLGFRDVVDSTGRVVYPAEAFLAGGRAFLVMPAGLTYTEKQGSPELQLGLNTSWDPSERLGFTVSSNYFSSVPSGRLKLITLPEALVFNVGGSYRAGPWRLKLDVFNVTNERYFRARNGDTLADALISVMPERRFQASVTRSF